MPHDHALTAAPAHKLAGPIFTVDRANRALVIVRRIVADIVARYRELTDVRAQLAELDSTARHQHRQRALQERGDHCVDVLNSLHRELTDVGCVLKDWRSGLVDFPALYQGRRVWLCWRLGEPLVGHWHELHDGAAGRRPLGGDFEPVTPPGDEEGQ